MNCTRRLLALLLLVAGHAGAADPLGEDFLKTDGIQIRNKAGTGEVVQLVGPNLGGWLLMESHLSPMHPTYANANDRFANVYDELTLRDTLDRRFGVEKRWELINAFQDAFITERDFQIIRDSGSNLVRLVIYYENHMDRQGAWHPWMFNRLKWAVEMGRKYGIYTLLDVHGPPGTPNGEDHSGQQTHVPKGVVHPTLTETRVLNLYTDPDRQARYYRFLTGLAETFAGDPAVAGYDIINEPKTLPELLPIMEKAYQAVRSVDPDHMIFMMYAFAADGFPDPKRYGFRNIVYASHFYNNADAVIKKARQVTDAFGVPVYIGEFHAADGGRTGILEAMTKAGLSYSWWTYKSWMNTMVKQRNGLANRPDTTTDSFDEIKRKWESFRTTDADSIISQEWMTHIRNATDAPTIRHPAPSRR